MLVFLSVLLVSTITFFRNIYSFPLRNWDEAWYAEIIKNMASDQYKFTVPFWNGRYYFDKPPLYFWLSSPFFTIFGPGEWQARIVSAIAAVLACVLIYLIGKKLASATTGLFSVVVFLTMGEVVIRFAHGNLDALLVALTLLTFYTFLNSDKKIYALLCSLSLGGVAMTKGWIFAFIPIFLILTYSQIVKNKLPKNLPLLIFPAIFIVFGYFIIGTAGFGKEFLSWYLANPSADLLNSPIKSLSLEFIKQTIIDIGPWFIPVIFSMTFLLSFPRKRESRFSIESRMTDHQKNLILTFVIVSLPYIFALNFLSEKLGWYLLPVYPFLAIIIGIFISNLFERWKIPTLILVLICTIFGIWNVNRVENIYPDRSTVGAKLGLEAQKLIPKEDTVILDDHDLTSFLYYSNHGEVFVSQNDPGKDWEWWIKTYDQIPDFAKQRGKTWIITKNPKNFTNLPTQTVSQTNGYTILTTTF